MKSVAITEKQCLSSLSHELRNPLASILSCVEVMNAVGKRDKETTRLLGVIDEKAMVMATVLDNFLSIADADESTHSKPVPVHGGLRVLVVDDNETAAENLGQLLKLRGYNVEMAHGGREGFQKALVFLPQAAILDIEMPNIDGYELAQMMQKENFTCSYIALTGYGQKHDKEKASTAGFHFHLTKPSRFKDVETILEKIASSIAI